MSRSLILALFLFSICQTTSAAIFKSYNDKKSCTEYSVVNKIKTESGEYIYQREPRENEEVITDKTIYGLSLKNITVNFNQRTASFDLIKNVTLGLNRPLFTMGTRVKVQSSNKEFNKIINRVNKKLHLITSICLDENQNIITLTHE